MTALSELKVKRRTIESAVTRIRNYTDSITEVDTDTCAQCIERKATLERCWQDYQQVQGQIDIIEEDDQDTDRKIFENNFYPTADKLRKIIDKYQLKVAIANLPQNDNGNNRPRTSDGNSNTSNIKPKLKLPTFDGKYDE